MSGKGDTPRPLSVSINEFSANWERIFSGAPKVDRKIIIVDIDKTILDGFTYDTSQPIKDRISKINELYDQGHTIIYWTARGGSSGNNADWYKPTLDTLEKYGAKYTELRMGKPRYDLWIDDKAINSDTFFNDSN